MTPETYREKYMKLKRELGKFQTLHQDLQVSYNARVGEIRFLRRHLEMLTKKSQMVLSRGQQYTKELKLGRKFIKYKEDNTEIKTWKNCARQKLKKARSVPKE